MGLSDDAGKKAGGLLSRPGQPLDLDLEILRTHPAGAVLSDTL
jgi:hypothetical protein